MAILSRAAFVSVNDVCRVDCYQVLELQAARSKLLPCYVGLCKRHLEGMVAALAKSDRPG